MRTFASLTSNNFRLWFFGSIVSIFGNWIQITALGFLIFDVTKSALYLGITGFAGGISAWFFTLYAGVIADHYPKRMILLITQILSMCLSAVLSILTVIHSINPLHIIIIAFFTGIVAAFEAPARQSIISELVERDNLDNAISLNSSLFNLGTSIGPGISGILYISLGPAWCFGINTISYIPVIISLIGIKLPLKESFLPSKPTFSHIKEGLHFSLSDSITRPVLGVVAVVSAFGFSVFNLMPAWAVSVLDGNAATNGMLQSARGVGALAGALTMATLGQCKKKGIILCAGAIIYPFVLGAFALTKSVFVSLILIGCIGTCFVVIYNTANTVLQILSPDSIRGRVMSIYMLSFLGTVPIGSLVGGIAAHSIGERNAVLLCSVAAFSTMFLIIVTSPLLRKYGISKIPLATENPIP